jgi:hypothetical protein
MKHLRSFLALLASVGVVTPVGSAASLGRAPVPKNASKPIPDLKLFIEGVGKTAEAGVWPAATEEKKLRETVQALFKGCVEAAGQKDRRLPLDIERLTSSAVVKEHKGEKLEGKILIAEDVRLTVAKNSTIYASGNVQITFVSNCVIVANRVRCNTFENSFVVAGEYIRLTGDRPPEKSNRGSVLLAGRWIRATTLDGTVCHVVRPGIQPPPDERPTELAQPAISTNSAKNVVYLNDRAETLGGSPNEQTYLPPKAPIAK